MAAPTAVATLFAIEKPSRAEATKYRSQQGQKPAWAFFSVPNNNSESKIVKLKKFFVGNACPIVLDEADLVGASPRLARRISGGKPGACILFGSFSGGGSDKFPA